jgi:uncharacterized protein YdiU (UPF0061 family)
MGIAAATSSPLAGLGSMVDNDYLRVLDADPDAARHEPNRSPRSVSSGHFVLVRPTPLPKPELVLTSSAMCETLQLDRDVCSSEDFLKLFSGGSLDGVPGFEMSWATPYALSIYGQEIVPNGAGPRGDGYGDGRAISIGEVAIGGSSAKHDGSDILRLELQLKGGGRTPFCRNADGRAVLRSSAREFIASEAMAAMGVPTTRALSLIASTSEKVTRPWYRNMSSAIAIGAHRPDRESGGDITRRERAAITTRVASSFLRVGQFELYGRRARAGDRVGLQQLEKLARHAIRREYPAQFRPEATLREMVLGMAREARGRFAHLAAEWLRVGYTQSNFNADNNLIGGATLDYGPFGFIERFEATWAMWIGGGQHFSFMNQPVAAGRNFRQFTRSLEPLLDPDGQSELRRIAEGYTEVSEQVLGHMWARKLGFPKDGAAFVGEKATALWKRVEAMMALHPTDFTIFFRQLAEVPAAATESDEVLLGLLAPAFYSPLAEGNLREKWVGWLRAWLAELAEAHERDGYDAGAVVEQMRRANPKFIPREWMLAEAYEAAEEGQYGKLRELHEVLQRPYDEQPNYTDRFYRRAPASAFQQGGIAFMS